MIISTEPLKQGASRGVGTWLTRDALKEGARAHTWPTQEVARKGLDLKSRGENRNLSAFTSGGVPQKSPVTRNSAITRSSFSQVLA